MTLILALECFGFGVLGMGIMFFIICCIPEIEDFFKKKPKELKPQSENTPNSK